ncbi:MAG: hypothetical protein J0H82_25975 [Alphaproteobacteria bacterium]|nr:hypothetical protein [Alphaproteobacteria bacterium]
MKIVEFTREHDGRGAGERATIDAGTAATLQRQGIARIVGDFRPVGEAGPEIDLTGSEAQPAAEATEVDAAPSPRRGKRAGDE